MHFQHVTNSTKNSISEEPLTTLDKVLNFQADLALCDRKGDLSGAKGQLLTPSTPKSLPEFAACLTEYTERNKSESIFYGTETRIATCTQQQ